MEEYNKLEDSRLVQLVQGEDQGDFEAFEELVKRYERKIYGHSLRILGNREDAEDVLQETFLNAFRAINSFRGDSSFSTWIYRIATNNALMKLRKSGRMDLEFNDDLPNISHSEERTSIGRIESPVDALFEKELLSELDEAVGKLPEKYRTIFLLRDVEEFSTEETAEILGITESAVKSRLHRARLFLRESLGHLMKGGALG